MKDKPFLNLDQQINHINIDKKILCSSFDKKSLARVGYFNLINGYKIPFTLGLDTKGNHIYERGTNIKNFISLKDFDDKLSSILFKVIKNVEQEVRSIFAYLFEKNIDPKITWRSTKAYNSKIAVDIVSQLISKMDNEMKERKNCKYISFYNSSHKSIPMWIVTKSIGFKTFIDLISNSKESVYLNLCSIYGIKRKNPIDTKKMLKDLLHWMRIVRNACAHNERIFCIQGNNKLLDEEILKLSKSYSRIIDKQRIFDLIIYLRYFLEKNEYFDLISEIKNLLIVLKSNISNHSFNRVTAMLGIKHIEDLDKISNDGFDNNYIILDK